MRISVTSTAVKEVEPVLRDLCASLQSEFQECMKDVELGQDLDQIAIIVTAVNNDAELNICRCASPVSVSSNSNFITGEKSKVLTIRPTLEASLVLQHRAEVLRNQILLDLINIISNIRTKRILESFDRDQFIEHVRSKIN